MELLEKLGIDGRLLLWQMINFAILLVILRKFAYRPILGALQKRTEAAEKALADAKKSAEALRSAEEEREDILSEARKKASAVINEAEETARRLRDEAMQKTKTEVQTMLETGRADLGREKKQMVDEARKELGSLVLMGIDKVIGKSVAKIDLEPLVAETVGEVKTDL